MAEYAPLVADQMKQYGIAPPDSFDIDGKIHRFPVKGKNKNNSWYALHYFRLDNGEQVITGRFGDWKSGVDAVVQLELPDLSEEEKARFKAEMQKRAKQAELERRKKAAEAAKRAHDIWGKLPVDGYSKYLQDKKVAAFGLRFSRGSVVVPLVNIKRQLVGLQFIDENGNKKFLTGTAKQGAFHFIGQYEHGVKNPRLLLAEGYATAASLHMVLKLPVVVCFDAGNLEPVAKVWRKKAANLDIIICGDNDMNTPGNPGLTKAKKAAASVGGRFVVPDSASLSIGSSDSEVSHV